MLLFEQMEAIRILGAEKQAATSVANAYPQREFTFVTQYPVIDGWDLGNVSIIRADRRTFVHELISQKIKHWIPLCPKWLPVADGYAANLLNSKFDLLTIFQKLYEEYPNLVLPISESPSDEKWIAKGNFFHKPDAIILSTDVQSIHKNQNQESGIVFQRFINVSSSYLVTGFRGGAGEIITGAFAIHKNIFGREEFLCAGETIDNNLLVESSLAMLDTLGHTGYFSFNWVESKGRYFMTSLRPVPVSVFGTFARAGFLMIPPYMPGINVLPAGLKFIVDLHYSSYKELAA